MSTNIPRGRTELLAWLEGIVGNWNTNFAVIGLTSAQVIDLAQNITSTRTAFTTVQSIRTQSIAKTQDFYTLADELRVEASGLVTTIKGFAETSDDAAAVYLAANITPKDPPSPVPAPEQPTNGVARLGGNGAVIINFDARGSATLKRTRTRVPSFVHWMRASSRRLVITSANSSAIGAVSRRGCIGVTRRFRVPTMDAVPFSTSTDHPWISA